MRKNTLQTFLVLHFFLPFLILRAETTESTAPTSPTNPWNIVIVGVVIVFISLIIVAVIISLFKYLSKPRKKKNKSRETSSEPIHKRITSITRMSKGAAQPIDQEVLSAIIAVIFLYESEVENQSKALLTMRRAKVSLWKQSTKLLMPNLVHWKKD